MAIQYNDITKIGDVFEVHANTPMIGIQSISGYTDVVLNETVDRYFTREFRYSLNGITYSDWLELSNEVLIDTFVPGISIFDIQYRYTRSGTDSTGFLTFISIELVGTIEDKVNPKIFTDLYFNKFFNYNDSSVLKWALNVLDKLYKKGIIANYVERGVEGQEENDEDFLAFFGALTHFFAILVRYAREYKDFTLNSELLTEYLRQKGLFVSDNLQLNTLTTLLENFYPNFLERGTNEIVKGIDTQLFDGELFRLLTKGDFDEFIWALIESEKTIWNVNNNSPLYKGTKEAVNLIKGYEYEQDVQDLTVYPLTEETFVTKYTDVDKEVIRILNSTSPNISGIGDALINNKLIIIDSRLSYEVTFYAKQVVLGNSLSLQVYLYDSDENLLLDSPISAVSGLQTNVVIDKEQLLQNDVYYFVRLILFNENIETGSEKVLDCGLGEHLIINSSEAKFMSIELGTEINDGNNDLRIWDFKIRPLMTPIPNSFVMIPNIITSYLENNSEDSNKIIENKIKRYLIPYNSVLKNQFLDELYVPEGTPLRIFSLTHQNETVMGADNGSITIIATGGKLPYLYSIDNGVTFQSTGVFTNLPAATYSIVVEDSLGVQVTDSVIISAGASTLLFNAFPTQTSRLDTSDGQIQVIASGGTPPYFYSIDGINFLTSNIFTGLAVGSYTVYVRDTDGTEISQVVTITAIRNRLINVYVTEKGSFTAIYGIQVFVYQVSEYYITNIAGAATIYLKDGVYKFSFSQAANAFRSESLDNIAITGDRTVTISLYRYYKINFSVNNLVGVGIPNATISTNSTPLTQDSFSVATPAGYGSVTKTNVIRGDYGVNVSATEYINVTKTFNINNADANVSIIMSKGYGYLYNYYAANNVLLAPPGWHIPSRAEWLTLIGNLGGASVAGGRMKEAGTAHWLSPNTGAVNSNGFNVFGAGGRNYLGNFDSPATKLLTKFWANTESSPSTAYAYAMYSFVAYIEESTFQKKEGMAIRLIKDDSNNPGSVTDIDGNVYPTVKIGNQVWTNRNLIVTKLNNGTFIPEVTSDASWAISFTAARCAVNNDKNNL